MTRVFSNALVLLLVATAVALPAALTVPARAGTLGGPGGEGGSWKYELYLKREAEAERQKARAGSESQFGVGQKAGLGTVELGAAAGPAPDRDHAAATEHTRGR